MSLTAWQVGRGPSSAPRSVERPAPASARSAHAVRRLRNLSARLDFCQPWWFVARQAAVECSHQIHVPASYWFRDRQASYFRILTVSSGIEAGFWGWFPGTGPCSFEHSPTRGALGASSRLHTRAAQGPRGPVRGPTPYGSRQYAGSASDNDGRNATEAGGKWRTRERYGYRGGTVPSYRSKSRSNKSAEEPVCVSFGSCFATSSSQILPASAIPSCW